MKNWIIPLIGFCLLFHYSCSNDDATDVESEAEQRDSHVLDISFDVVMTKGYDMLNPSDFDQLSTAEKSLLAPTITKASVQSHIDREGGQFTNITFIPHEYDVPTGALGLYSAPAGRNVTRIEMANGSVRHYNAENQIIHTSDHLDEYLWMTQVIDELTDAEAVEPQYFDAIFDAFTSAGYTVTDYSFGRGIRIPGANGEVTEVLVHNEFQSELGYITYDASGEVLNSSIRVLDKTGSTIEVKSHLYKFPFELPESGVRLAYEIKSHLSNYQIQINQ